MILLSFVYAFIDWENIEKTAKQDYGSILNYDEFNTIIRTVSTENNSLLVGIKAFGDFDKGIAGLMTKLVNLGIQPCHVVTKSPHEYLKGSTDIVMSLDILKTMYTYPHITEFMFVSGDSDLRYVITELRTNGKSIKILGFKDRTSKFIIEMANNFISLDEFPNLLRKVTESDKEHLANSLMFDKEANILIKELDMLEGRGKKFIGLNYFRSYIIDHNQTKATNFSDALTKCKDCDIIEINTIENPNDPDHPTRACKLNRNNRVVQYILGY